MIRTVSTAFELSQLLLFLKKRKRPFSVEITDGRKRSSQQNRTAHMWFKEAAEQLGDRTPSDVRAYCKLRFGVSILRAENEEFREKYDRIIRRHSYADQLEMMVEPFDFPVTRLMSVEQQSRFMEQVQEFLLSQGIVLTDPMPKEAA